MKKTVSIILVLCAALLMTACAKTDAELSGSIGGTYVWENEGFGGPFTITLNEDGTYEYSVGYLSSYIGMGNWKLEDGVIVMTETSGYDYVFRFKAESDRLVYVSDGSSGFGGVDVADGDSFTLDETADASAAQ